MVKISAKWGVVLGIALVVGTQVLTWLGLGLTNWYIGFMYFAVAIVALLAAKNLKSDLKEQFGFIKIIFSMLIIVIISRYIFQTYMYVYTNYIDPDWVMMVTEKWTKMLQEQNVSAENIDKQIAIFHKSYEPLQMFTVEIVFIGLSQFILGCIVAGIYKWITKDK